MEKVYYFAVSVKTKPCICGKVCHALRSRDGSFEASLTDMYMYMYQKLRK